eukprot:TRINITY_DN12085_c0_g1_i1.p1 TRINITY_DN12085_c0_g1~~TRINITY_DN12085_c0_g1_i1.p1  ORF type:complete len:339 (-),score=101.49 TRINITY_DN12085_c0_g1_i1:26-1042(-)
MLARAFRRKNNRLFNRRHSTVRHNSRVLVLAEHDNAALDSSTFHSVAAAAQLGSVEVLVAGHNCSDVATQASKLTGVEKVHHIDQDYYENVLAENYTDLLLDFQGKQSFNYVLTAANSFGKNVLPRFCAKLDIQPVTDIQQIVDKETFIRPIYAGDAVAKVKSTEEVKVLSIRPASFPKAEEGGSAEVVTGEAAPKNELTNFVSASLPDSDRPDLGSANIVVSGGRGLKNGDNFDLLYKLADTMGAAVGASRAAVDDGFVPKDMQIGQTGKIVAPDLYFAVAISGAIQHLAGMKDSKVIVAINTDADAPIFQVSDYGLVADLFDVVPKLTEGLKKLEK